MSGRFLYFLVYLVMSSFLLRLQIIVTADTIRITSPQFHIDIAMQIILSPNDLPFNAADKLDVLVYPKPVSNALYIDGNFNNTATIELYNMLGRKIMTEAKCDK